MSDDLSCTNCGEYVGSPIADRIEELEAENKHLRLEVFHANDTADVAINQLRILEAKLVKAVAELEGLGFDSQSILGCELKGQDDE